MRKFFRKLIPHLSVLVLLTSCALPGLGGSLTKESIGITGGFSTEMSVLGYIVEGMVNHYIDTETNVITNLSSTMNHQATMIKDADISAVRYTGTSLTGELGYEAITDPEEALDLVIEGFEKELNQKWFPSYGFANTYAFMVRQDTAEEYDLEKTSDLEDFKDEFKVGVDTSWLNREGDGYESFQELYGFEFSDISPMALGLIYTALSNNEIDLALGYSTDGRIIAENLVILEDDLNLFPPYDASPVANHEILEIYPELEDIFTKLEGQIDQEIMQELNYKTDNYLLEPRIVAQEWLEENNFFVDREPYLEPVESDVR